jgi:hypothetical protein
MSKTVCTNFSELQDSLKRVKALAVSSHRMDDVQELQEVVADMLGHVMDMYDNAHDMHRGAEAMEERLRLYRSAIESLGFKRDLTAPKV